MLSSFLISQDFSKGSVEPTLFICKEGKELILVQVYVDDIIFDASTPELCDLFAKIMCSKFKISMMGKISFFLGLQIFKNPRGIFINQSKYALKSLKKHGFDSSDPVDTPMVEKSKLDEDKKGKDVDPSHYRGMTGTLLYLTATFVDVDHASCQDTRRSTSGSMQFLGDTLVSWSSKRQKSVGISSTEAEYIAMSGCCFADSDVSKLARGRSRCILDSVLGLLLRIYTSRLLDAACKKVLNLLKKGLLKVKAMSKSAWTEKDQIDNFLKERRWLSALVYQGLSTDSCFISHGDYTHFYQLSHSKLVDIEKNIRVISFTMKMEILLEPTSNKLMVEHIEFDESDTHVLERLNISAGNPVKEILLKLNLPDHRLILKDLKENIKSDMELKNFKKDATLKLFKSTNQERCSISLTRQAKEQAQDLKSMNTLTIHKLMIKVKDYELKTKVEA
ncbi:retrovirus-related pol polyprotein from transposon TNT 1-94 [Tanacetum coccineum]